MAELLPTDPVDTLTAPQMANWLRETARITRARGQASPTPAEMRVAPHVAFRLEQAAELLLDLQQFHDWALPQITPPDDVPAGPACSACGATRMTECSCPR